MKEIQNVNLLESLQIRPPSKLTALFLFKIIGLFYLFFVLIASVVWAYTMQKKMVLNSLQQGKVALEKTVKTQFARSLGLEGGSQNYSNGFSPYLLVLAEITPLDIWLKNITFAEGNNMVFDGETFDADLIPDFIEALNKDETVNGVFSAFVISKSPIDKRRRGKVGKDREKNLDSFKNVISFSLGAIVESNSQTKKP